MATLSSNNIYYSTLGRHLKHELSGVEFKLSDKITPKRNFSRDLNKLVVKTTNGTDKYKYSFDLEKSVIDDFNVHEISKLSVKQR